MVDVRSVRVVGLECFVSVLVAMPSRRRALTVMGVVVVTVVVPALRVNQG